ncbi:Mth938-like domain-containing protein [Chloroflexota bacterium]
MNIIDSYHFGKIVINGKNYSSDVIIFPDRIRDNWHRKTGHKLCLEDIAEVITENTEVLIVGTGASGLMKILPEVEQIAQAQGIKIIAKTTDKACSTYNQLSHSQMVVAALHLTC